MFSKVKNKLNSFFTIWFTLNNSVTKWYFFYVTQQSVINVDTSLTYYMSAYEILLEQLMARLRVAAPLQRARLIAALWPHPYITIMLIVIS